MKRKLQKMIALLAILFVPFFLSAQEYGSILNESFEEGIPSTWTQENVSGNVNWVVETGGNYPKGAYFGEKRLIFCSNASVSTNAVTRLVTPILDGFSSLRDPILVFAHAQDKWTNDFDTLKVLYRSAGMKDWALLKVYDRYIARWQVDTISLTFIAGARDFQIAFQASDNLGRGVVLDNVEVRSAPSCFVPEDIAVKNITNNSAEITWFGAWDAESFAIKVSTTPLSDADLSGNGKADVKDEEIDSETEIYLIDNLNVNTKYYFYLRTNCYGEYSKWHVDSFQTYNLLEIPHTENFNLPANPGFADRLPRWYYGSSEGVAAPFINTGHTSYLFEYSADSTFALMFYGQEFSDHPTDYTLPVIPERAYSYAAMPKIKDTDKIQDLQVSFWSVAFYAAQEKRPSNLIVGVMEDPEDITTFTAVDTIISRSPYTRTESIVSFENYKGEGRYVAFLSQFDTENKFSMDNLVLSYRPKVAKINDFKIGLPKSNTMKIDIRANVKYSKYEVVLSKQEIPAGQIDNAIANDSLNTLIHKEIVDGGTIDSVEICTEYYVYLRGVEGTDVGEWSNYQYVHTPGIVTEMPHKFDALVDSFGRYYSTPYTYTVKTGNMKESTNYMMRDMNLWRDYYNPSSGANAPTVGTIAKSASSTLRESPFGFDFYATTATYTKSVLIFPEIEDRDSARIEFFAGAATTYSAGYLRVGFMSDANDVTTFEEVDKIFLPKGGYEYYFWDMEQYKDKGRFFAVMADAADWQGYLMGFLDEVQVVKIPTCRDATNVEVITDAVDNTHVELKWDAEGVPEWIVNLYTGVKADEKNLVLCDTVDTAYIDFINLNAPGYTYCYTIQPICGETQGRISLPKSFTTVCLAQEKIPYFEDFEDPTYVVGNKAEVFAVPCMYSQLCKYGSGTSAQYWPYINNSKVANATTKKILFQKSSTNKYRSHYVAMPKFEKPIKDLQISFDFYAGQVTGLLRVGVMTDPMDSLTIEEVAVIHPKATGKWINYVVTLDSYKGTGEYIAIGIAGAECTSTQAMYVDNIKVDIINQCSRPENLELQEYGADYAKLGWTNPTAVSKWAVLFASAELTDKDFADIDTATCESVLRIDTVTSNPAIIQGLISNTSYYVYVKSVCGVDGSSDWCYPINFRTACDVKTPEQMGVEQFDDYGYGTGKAPDCWLVGNSTVGATTSYIPYCYSSQGKTKGSLYINSTATGTTPYNGAYAISPYIGVDDISKYRLKLWATTSSASYTTDKYAHSIIVGIVTNPSNLATFERIDTLVFDVEKRPYEVYFDKYEGDYLGGSGKYIMFLSEFDKDNRVYIDEVEISLAPECRTDFDFKNITDTSVEVEVLAGKAPYQLICVEKMYENSVLDTLPAADIKGNSYTINDLEANTDYYVYMRSTCGKDWTEWSLVKVVRTGCSPTVSLPYSEGFEANKASGSGTLPQCWYTIVPNNDYAKVYVYGSSSYLGSRNMLMETTSAVVEPYIVSQAMDIDSLYKCTMTFYGKPYSSSSSYFKTPYVVVGVVEDLNNIERSFVPVDTVMLEATAWTKYEISFENYKGLGKNIGFTSPFILNGKQARYYLDEIYVEITPTCPRPDNFSILTATDTCVTLTFDYEGAMKYEVRAGLKGFDVENDKSVVSVVESTETTITVGNLLPGRTYDFYVKVHCSATDASPWAYAGNAKTLEEYVKTLPYYCNFENADENSSWIILDNDQTDKWYIGLDDEYTVAENYSTTDSALYISYNGGVTAQYFNFLSKEDEKEGKENNWSAYSASYAYRTIYFEPGIYNISYKWKCEGIEGQKGDVVDYAKVALIPISSTFNAGANQVTAKNGNRTNFDNCSNGGGEGTLSADAIVDYFDLTQSLCGPKAHGCDYCYALHGSSDWNTAEKTITVTPKNAGAYNLVFFWFNQEMSGAGDETRTRPSPAFDDIAIVPQTCVAPYGLDMTLFDYESVDLTWIPFVKTDAYQVLLATTDTVKVDLLDSAQIAYNDSTVRNTNVHITGLTPSTTYYAYVRSVCTEGNFSDWVGPFEFATSCAPFVVDSVYSFDEMALDSMWFAAEGTYSKSSSLVPQCFISGNSNSKVKQTTTYRSYYPSTTKNGSGNTTLTTHYSRSGSYKDGKAIKFRHTSADNAGGYLVLPLFDGEMESMYLNFWMRCVVHNDYNSQFKPGQDNMTSTTLLEGVASNASRKITVGSMTNPNDPTTFKAANVFEYPYTESDITSSTKVTDDPTGNDFWVRFSMPLKGLAGKYIVFKDEMYNDGCKFNVVYIDDIEVTYRTCAAPSGLSVDNIRMNSAVLNVTQQSEANEFMIQLANDNAFETVVLEKTVTSFPVTLDKLAADTRFFARIKSICSKDEQSEWSAPYVFNTLKGVVYDQNFNEVRLCPEDWKRSGGSWSNSDKPALTAADVLDKNVKFAYLDASEKGEHWQPETWQFKEKLFNSGMFTSNHMAVTMTSKGAHWLFSPVIDLNNASDKYHMSFDVALTDMGNNSDIFGNFITNLESRFMVVVSDDAGATWKSANATVWGAGREAYIFHSIPATGRTYSIDLSKHAGKTIMIAFYAYTNLPNSNDAGDLHIDNVHINAYKENPLTESICESVDFNNDQFSIVSDDMTVGTNKFNTWELSYKAGTYDTYHSLTLNVKEMIVTNLSAEVCESDVYSGYNFTGLEKPGVYKQKLTSSNGCDSLVVLNLSGIPTIRTEVYDSICQGASYTWNGKVYNRTGIYSETFVSKVTGCDSIASLVLKVRDVLRYDSYVNICFGDTLVFGDKEITQTGLYEHTFKTADGCDSLVMLHATVLPDYTNMVINAVIEEGEVYNENGFFGISKPGKYTLALTTSDGCDSIITLNLIVGNATHYLNVNICNGETYQFGSQTITESGQYLETFAEDSIVLLNATVLPDLRQTIDAYICKGEVYNENGFSGKSETGIYTLPLTSVDGCDSTITLNLTVLTGETTEITKRITTDELPYENKELGLYYDGATKPGTYTDVIELEAANCKDVIIHTLIVELADALVDVMATDLILYPNPVNTAETLYIDAEFTTSEREGLSVEVFNTVGQIVYTSTPIQYPIAIEGLKDSGVYIVRVQTGDGNIYQGKVIVK